MERYSKQLMRNMGIEVMDAGIITQSRFEASYDGLHYLLKTGDDNWMSQVANMVAHVMMNTVMTTCGELADSDPVFNPNAAVSGTTPQTAGAGTTIPSPAVPPAPPKAGGSCQAPDDPFASNFLTGPFPASKITSLSGTNLQITLSEFKNCAFGRLVLAPDAGGTAAVDVLKTIDASLHLYVATNLTGEPCFSMVNCTLISRRIPLRLSDDGKTILGIVVPDASSSRYVFTVQVLCFTFRVVRPDCEDYIA